MGYSRAMANALKIHVTSLGCPKNRVDTETMLGALGPLQPVDDPAGADLVLVNTCGFIRPAVEESLATILELARDMEDQDGSRGVLAVAGCLVSRYGQDLKAGLPEVDLWLSTHELDRWPALAAQALGAIPGGAINKARVLSTKPYAYLKISEGCDHSCAFCTIPSIRGPQVSRSPAGLINEARAMLDQGAREIVVVGQDVTNWGADTGEDIRELISGLAGIKHPSLHWLRLMYLYPAGLTEPFLSFLREVGPPLVPYFDVPIQHAHPDILSAMGRPFARDPRKVIERIRKYFPEAAIRTTFIVGFPGETDRHFSTLSEFVGEIGFTHLGVFAYQREEGTTAADMPGQVEEEVKEARRAELMELQAGISRDRLEGLVGERLEVLVEAEHPEWPGLMTGRTWFQAPEVDGVTFLSAPPERTLKPGDIVTAEVESCTDHDLSALADDT